jgi:HSP20 family molecular chaperone IbpA
LTIRDSADGKGKSKFKNGVSKIRLPKTEEAKKKEITVKVG